MVFRSGSPAYAGDHRRLAAWVAILVLTIGINLLAVVPALAVLHIFDHVIPQALVENLVIVLLWVGLVLVIEVALSGVRTVLIAWDSARQDHATGRQLFASILSARPDVGQQTAPGSHLERFAAISRKAKFQSGRTAGLWLDLPFAVLFLGLIFALGGWIVAVPVALVLALVAVIAIGDRSLQRAATESAALRSRQTSFALETLARIPAIKSAAVEAPMLRRFERLIDAGAEVEGRIARADVPGQVAQTTVVALAMVGVAAAGGPGIISGSISMGELAACVLLAGRALYPVERALSVWTEHRRVGVAQSDVAAGLSVAPSRAAGAVPLPALQGAVALEGVTIRSGADHPPLLDGVSIDVPAGAMIGITGAAGSGKTTLLMLVAGQRRPDAGRVLLDGRFDPLEHTEDSLSRQVVYVPGQAPIYTGTLLDNITMFVGSLTRRGGHRPAQCRDRAHDLAERLGLTHFARCLPLGFNTVIGPGSAYALPPGLVQRIALARAFFAAPRVLLFDAANTALDPAGDALVRRLLEEERGTCTMLIVSQRPSLLRLTDRVYTIADGELRSPLPSRYVSLARQRVSA